MDLQTRASAALRVFQSSIANDDQDVFDLLSAVIERDGLYLCYASDDGQSFRSFAEFVAEVQRENPSAFTGGSTRTQPSGIVASASAAVIPYRQMTPQQRRADRLARAARMKGK